MLARTRRLIALAALLSVNVPIGAQAAVGRASRIPSITRTAAAHYSAVVLRRKFGSLYGFAHRCRRTDRTHARCRVGWFQGDGSFYGRTRISYSRAPDGEVVWDYAYRIVLLDTYCAQVQHRHHCTHIFVVN